MSEIADPDQAPPANRGLHVLAGLLLLLPCLAIIPVGWYSKAEPKLGGWPFFVWYQMMWVPLCAICTSLAFILVKRARPHVPIQPVGAHAAHDERGDA